MCAIKPEPSVYSEHSLDTLSRTGVFVFWLFLTLKLFLETGGGEKAVSAAAAAMVFCVGCGNQLLGRYCRQCGAEDSQWTFFYLQTHKTELQEQTTKDAIKKSFQDTGITPFKDGEWKKYVETSFQTQGTPAASHILHKVHKLQQKTAISAYLFKLGLDDQNPEDWNDDEVRKDLVVPDPSDPSSDEGGDPREGEGDRGVKCWGRATDPVLTIPSPVTSSSEEEEDLEHDMEEEQEEKKEASRKRKKR